MSASTAHRRLASEPLVPATAWWALPVAAGLVALVLHGLWALAGAAAGLAAAWAVWDLARDPRAAAVAAALPPLGALGEAALAAALLLGLAAAAQRVRRPEVLLLGAAALLLPLPGVWVVAAVAGAAYLAWAPGARALAGLAVALLPAALATTATGGGPGLALLGGAVAAGAAVAARAVANHPANLTMGRRIAEAGLVAMPAPALALYGVAAFGRIPDAVGEVFVLAPAAGALGALLLGAHLGAALLLRTGTASRALWLTLTWTGLGLAGVLFTEPGLRAAVGASAPWLFVSAAVPAGIGTAWVWNVQVTRHPGIRNVH